MTTNHNLFPYCEQIWDENKNTFREADSIEISKCCQNNCDKTYNFCINECNKKDKSDQVKCKNKCIALNRNLCYSFCELPSKTLQIDNNFYKCTGKYNCNYLDRTDVKNPNQSSSFPDKECVNKNKDDIYKCCMDTCDTSEVKCKEYCDFFIKLPFEDMSQINENTNILLSNSKNISNNSSNLYVLVIVLLTIILVILIMYVKNTFYSF
jgi:hypothetical protein